jgi:hypothetical protein
MKKGVLTLLPVFFINLVSAQFFSGYGRFSITDLFYSIDPPTMTLGLLFLIFFAFIFFVLGRVFKDSYGQPNKGIAGTISFAVSALIIYGLWSSGFDLSDIFYSLGLSSDLLYFLLPVIILLASLLIIWKFEIRGFLIIFGLFIMILTIFTEVIYEKGIAFVIGLVMFLIGLELWRRKRKEEKGLPPRERGPGIFGGLRQRRRDISEARHRAKTDSEYQRIMHEREAEHRVRNIARIRKRRGGGSQPPQVGPQRYQQAQTKKKEAQLTHEQEKRWKKRQKYVREINNQLKMVEKSLRRANLSEETRKNFEQRRLDLINRKETLLRYTPKKGNL